MYLLVVNMIKELISGAFKKKKGAKGKFLKLSSIVYTLLYFFGGPGIYEPDILGRFNRREGREGGNGNVCW